MKYPKLLMLLFVPLFFASCKKEEIIIPTCVDCSFTCLEEGEPDVVTNSCVDDWTCTFSVFPASRVEINERHGFKEGNNNVFFMERKTEGDPAISDDKFNHTLVFELNANQTSFSVEDRGLADMNTFFRVSCYCTEVEFKKVFSGCLQGEKQVDGRWRIQGDMTIPYEDFNFELKIDAQFELE